MRKDERIQQLEEALHQVMSIHGCGCSICNIAREVFAYRYVNRFSDDIIILVTVTRSHFKTNKEMAEFLGVEAHSIPRWLSGKFKPTPDKIEAMKKLCKMK
jgi:hypothetical protein